jgi:hypothetical protein
MESLALYAATFIIFMHGLIHLMGFTAYWKLAELKELPYKTTLLDGRWDVGDGGIRMFGALWLVVAVAYMIVTYGLLTEQEWWRTMMAVVTISSLVLTILDANVAYAGVVVNIVILGILIISSDAVQSTLFG